MVMAMETIAHLGFMDRARVVSWGVPTTIRLSSSGSHGNSSLSRQSKRCVAVCSHLSPGCDYLEQDWRKLLGTYANWSVNNLQATQQPHEFTGDYFPIPGWLPTYHLLSFPQRVASPLAWCRLQPHPCCVWITNPLTITVFCTKDLRSIFS